MRNLLTLRFIYLFLLISCQLPSLLNAQQVTIIGRVTVFNSQKPLNSVFVKANSVKNQQAETTNEGIFKLVFVEPDVGKKYKINVYKKDYEVVNEESLYAVAGQTDTLDVIMVLSQEVADARQQFYKVFKTSSEKLFKEKTKNLEKLISVEKNRKIKDFGKIKALEAELEKTAELFALADQKAKEAARVLAFVSLDEEPEDFVSAIKNLKSGAISVDSACWLIDKGIAQIDSIMLEKEYAAQKTNLEKKCIKWRLIKGALYKSQLRFEELDKEFQYIIHYKSAEKDNAQLFLDYANFKGEWLKQYDTAVVYYRKANAASPDLKVRLKILNEWGNAYFLKGDLRQARQQFDKVWATFTSGEADSTEYEPSVAEIYGNFGMIESHEKKK